MDSYLKKDHEGITLIALVVTIIVLLILAGISIATLTGNNGLIKKAVDSKDLSVRADEEESIKLAYNGIKSRGDQGEINAANMREELGKLDKNVTVKYWKNGDIAIKYNDTKHIYTLEQDGTIEEKEEEYKSRATFMAGPEMNIKMKKLSGDENPTVSSINNAMKSFKFSETEPSEENKKEDNIVSISESEYPIYMWFDNGTIYWWSEEAYPLMNTDSSRIFSLCQGLEDVSGIANWNCENVTSLSYMFNMYDPVSKTGGGKLKEITEMKYWNTNNVENTSRMFQDLISIETIEIGDWDTSNINNLRSMFSYCYSLKNIDVSKWNTSKVVDMRCMFLYAKTIEKIDVSAWDTSNVEDMGSLFSYCLQLKSIDVAKWKMSKVKDTSAMFQYDQFLEKIEVGNWDTSNVENMMYMFSHCHSLKNLDVYNWNTGKVTNMDYLFYCNYASTDVNVSKWNTTNVTTMDRIFRSCYVNAEHLKNWDTSNCENMAGMFLYLDAPILDLSKWNTSKCKHMERLFFDCSVRELLINDFDMSKVETYEGMFQSVSTSCRIVTNQATKEWLNEHFPAYTNIEVVEN